MVNASSGVYLINLKTISSNYFGVCSRFISIVNQLFIKRRQHAIHMVKGIGNIRRVFK